MERLLGVGFDICEVERIKRSIQRWPFIEHHFADPEIDYCELASDPLRSQRYAARWSAKEVVTKAMGESGSRVPFRDIIVLHYPSGMPFIHLEAKAKSKAEGLGITVILLSLAHEQRYAGALCLAISGEATEGILRAFNSLQTAFKNKMSTL